MCGEDELVSGEQCDFLAWRGWGVDGQEVGWACFGDGVVYDDLEFFWKGASVWSVCAYAGYGVQHPVRGVRREVHVKERGRTLRKASVHGYIQGGHQ